MNDVRNKPTSLRWMVIGLLVCLISGLGTWAVQTSGGSVQMKDMTWQSADGRQLSGYLLIPPNATPETPAPAVVAVHGWYNSKEMQDPFFVELSRRGYVVLAMDMKSHGNSEAVPSDILYDGAVGVDDAVVQLSTMKFVDQNKIGVTGHSSGASASNQEISLDSARAKPLVSAVLLQANDWNDDSGEDHTGDLGNRSYGIIADKYDDFNFWMYNDNDEVASIPRDFITTDKAKEILNFNADASTFPGTPQAGHYYSKEIDGKTAYRVIYTPDLTHVMVPFSTVATAQALEFFDKAFGYPTPIDASNQIWPWKALFNLVGLAGFLVFMVSLTLTLARTPFFAEVSTGKPVEPAAKPRGAGAAWFWGGLIVSALFSGISYRIVAQLILENSIPAFFPQKPPFVIGVWAAVCGVFAILVMALTYRLYGKRNGFSLRDTGVAISWRNVGKTIVLAVTVVALSYAVVFVTQYFFHADFRFWLASVKTFGPDILGVALRYLPLFAIYYVANSVAVNCFNFNKLAKWPWVNTVVVALAASIPVFFIVVLHYAVFIATGTPFWTTYKSSIVWLIPVGVILFVAAVISRIVYRRTGNAYLPGLINAMVVTLITCATSATILA